MNTIIEQALITERSFAPSRSPASRPALPLPRLRAEDEAGLLWDRVRERDLGRLREAVKAADCVPA